MIIIILWMAKSSVFVHCFIKNLCSYVKALIADFLSFLARLLILIKKGGLLQLKFGVVGVGVGVNIYLWAR